MTLEEEDIDWLAGNQTSVSARVEGKEGKGQTKSALGRQEPDQPSKHASRQARAARPLSGRDAGGSASSGGQCVYDEEEGGMVMLADEDDDVGLHLTPAPPLLLRTFKDPERVCSFQSCPTNAAINILYEEDHLYVDIQYIYRFTFEYIHLQTYIYIHIMAIA